MLTNNFISFNYIFTSGGYTLETLNNELFLFFYLTIQLMIMKY
jgi:uncharacterized membrane protein YciS (DUF1049 family)